jgi:KDO2-lipid IV(A) lauroyltransferase
MSNLVNADDLANMLYKIMPLKALIQLAKIQGKISYRYGHAGKTVHNNLKKYFGDTHSASDIERMSREFFEWERVRSLMASLAPAMSADKLSNILTIEGEEHLDAALKRGKGAILLGSHLNSIVLFVAITMWRKRGYKMGVAFPDEEDAWGRTQLRTALEKLVGRRDTLSEAVGGFYCQFNIRPILKRLQENQVIGQTGDGWHSANFVETEFLGRKLPFTTASWSVAQVSGAAIIPIFITGNPSGGMRLILEEPITFDDSTDKQADMKKMITQFSSRLEHYLQGSVPAWQHWLTPNTLDALVEWTEQDIEKRYEMH